MSNYCMNNRSQGMRYMPSDKYKPSTSPCTIEEPAACGCTASIHWHDKPIAMAYVPKQKYGELFDLSKALEVGTIFPELCKPFCGKGGGC